MSIRNNYPLFAAIMVLLQAVICNYVYLGPYVTISILPAVILFMPLKYNEITDMLIAFVIALAVDWLADGVLGLNAAALLPVGFSRRFAIKLFFGADTVTRQERFSIRKNGAAKVMTAIVTVTALFLLVYIILDGAGARPFSFNVARFFASLGASIVMAPLLAYTFSEDTRR